MKNYNETTAFALEFEKSELDYHNKYAEEKQIYTDRIERDLSAGTQEAKDDFIAMFSEPGIEKHLGQSGIIPYMYVIMRIYEYERSKGEQHTILDIVSSSADAKALFTQLKFVLWRISLALDETAPNLLINFIDAFNISPYMLLFTVKASSFDEIGQLMNLADVFIAARRFRFAFCILQQLDELNPGNETILCTLADLSGYIGNLQMASTYISKITNKGKLTEEIIKKYGL